MRIFVEFQLNNTFTESQKKAHNIILVQYQNKYQSFQPIDKLKDVIDSFWIHQNFQDTVEQVTISPDSYFKILVFVQDGKIINYFKTGIWTEPKEIDIPPKTYVFGSRFNILAAEYLFGYEISHLKNTTKPLSPNYLNIRSLDFSNADSTIVTWQKELLKHKTKLNKPIDLRKLRLAQALYQSKGSLSAKELADQIYMTNRTINRYLNKYFGISLKKYIAIQRAFEAYSHIRKGQLSPTKDFYDQSHYIREIKKHTGTTPRSIFKGINDRFIQLRNIH